MTRFRFFARRAAFAALAILSAAPAGAEGTEATGDAACAARYHASLQTIRSGDYAALKAGAAAATGIGDPNLPGTYLFPPQGRPRSRAEIAALTAGTALVRSRGRSFGNGSEADRTWITARLREDLGDYLGQGMTPYLCSGVPAYLETLRGYAGRLGLSPQRREALVATQTAAARKALIEARAALAAKTSPAADALRPAAPLDRAAVTPPETPTAAPAPVAAPAPTEIPLATSEDIAAAARGLLDAMGGGLSAPLDPVATGGAASSTYPALQAIALAKPALAGRTPLVADAKLRRSLASTFSELEVLDYLLRSRALESDPTASAIEATLTAIETAHKTDCTCRN